MTTNNKFNIPFSQHIYLLMFGTLFIVSACSNDFKIRTKPSSSIASSPLQRSTPNSNEGNRQNEQQVPLEQLVKEADQQQKQDQQQMQEITETEIIEQWGKLIHELSEIIQSSDPQRKNNITSIVKKQSQLVLYNKVDSIIRLFLLNLSSSDFDLIDLTVIELQTFKTNPVYLKIKSKIVNALLNRLIEIKRNMLFLSEDLPLLDRSGGGRAHFYEYASLLKVLGYFKLDANDPLLPSVIVELMEAIGGSNTIAIENAKESLQIQRTK